MMDETGWKCRCYVGPKMAAEVNVSDQWGLENSIKKLQQQATETAAVYNGTAEEFWEAHKQLIDGREFLVVKDYNGREWKMDRKTFDIHLIKYYKGSAIVVSCKIENDTLMFKTWYQLKDKNKRKGLLLKKGI